MMQRPYTKFIFKSYHFDEADLTARFSYAFDDSLQFSETVTFSHNVDNYSKEALDRALQLTFLIIGTSYYKAFPNTEMVVSVPLDEWQARFFNKVYQEGLSQYAFENNLTRHDLAVFTATGDSDQRAGVPLQPHGTLAMQSGGKDSLLLGSLLNKKAIDFDSLYVSTADYPKVIDKLERPVRVIRRSLDRSGLARAKDLGGLNGHVPVTYHMCSFALIQAILGGYQNVMTAVGNEGAEPHARVGTLDIMHQWSKTWPAEQDFAEYVRRYVSPDLQVGSPLRQFTELRIAELFAIHAWPLFGHEFSSCNIANYQQGHTNERLSWCANCPKCANNFLLFAPFVAPTELIEVFNGENLLQKPELQEIFKGLVGVEGVMKPFECVGEIDELRCAYWMAREAWPETKYQLSFDVPKSTFNYQKLHPMQSWAQELNLVA